MFVLSVRVVAHTIATVPYCDTKIACEQHLLLLVPLLPDFSSSAVRNNKVIAAGTDLIDTVSHTSVRLYIECSSLKMSHYRV